MLYLHFEIYVSYNYFSFVKERLSCARTEDGAGTSSPFTWFISLLFQTTIQHLLLNINLYHVSATLIHMSHRWCFYCSPVFTKKKKKCWKLLCEFIWMQALKHRYFLCVNFSRFQPENQMWCSTVFCMSKKTFISANFCFV